MAENTLHQLIRDSVRISRHVWIVRHFFLVYFLTSSLSILAQSSQEIYAEAIDKLNFATMHYVLADDKQKPEALKLAARLDDLSYDTDTLIKEIANVYGANSRTQDLCVKINRYKEKFNGNKPADKQLNRVIEFINADRKKKSYHTELETKLYTIQQEAIAMLEDNGQVMNVSASQLQATPQPLAAQQAAFPDLMSFAVIVFGLISLANLWLYFRFIQRRRTSTGEKEDYYKTVRQSIDFEIYPRLEKNNENLEKKIESLRQELLALLKEANAQEQTTPKPVQTMPPKPAVEQKITESKPVAPLSISPNNAAKVVTLQVNKAVQPELSKPVRKYADYPKENGFVLSQLQDVSDRRSIYEITIPNGGEQAHFTVVDNKELHEYAIQNRERLLKDACDFEISSSQHTRIEVVKPGKLLKNGNSWQITEKAKIKFV